MKLPPLRAVQYFEVVARLLSFSRAALELNVSQSAVSHQIRLLEDFLGERLLLRQGRLLSLTPQGESYFEGIAAGLSQIAQSSAGEAEQPGHHLEILQRTQGRKLHYLNISWVVIFYHFTGYRPPRYPPLI